MTINLPPQIQEEAQKNLGWAIALSIVLIILGIAALFMPVLATLVVTTALGWIFLITGIVRFVKSFQSKPIRGFWLNLLIGILYFVAGITLLTNLLQGALTLTLAVGLVFITEGIFEIVASFRARTGGNLSWLVMIDGIITLILGIFVLNKWPYDSLWLIGLYTGISIIFSGISLLTISSATQKAVSA